MANKCEQFETGSESNNSETVVDCTSKTVSSEDEIKDKADKANEGNDASGAPTLSKNQIKKMKRKEKWEQVKATKRYIYVHHRLTFFVLKAFLCITLSVIF